MYQYLYLVLFVCFSTISWSQDLDATKLSSRLLDKIEAEPQAFYGLHIILADKVDVPAMDAAFYARKASLSERTYEVITALQEKANNTQPEILALLEASEAVEKSSIHGFWIVNVIFAKVQAEMVETLSKHPAVEYIDLNSELLLEDYERVEVVEENLQPDGIEPGLAAINAPAMWAKGYTGYGRKAFILDTGGVTDHPALRQQYWGNHVAENEAWFDLNGQRPYDCNDHGTHVSGTTLGLDRQTNDTIGVAFNASWMSTPQLGCSYYPDYPGSFALIASFQWAMNPDSNLQTIHDMPDAINNSWYDPRIEDDCTSIYLLALNSLESVGIAVVFSAGNAGPEPGTITPPHNINTSLVNGFAVAAVNANGSGNSFPAADFSSRGPSICGGEGSLLIKPEVSAPGVNVRSSVPGGYDFFSGTSMAAPHTTGAIILLKEAFPELTGTELKLALYFTCSDLGEVGEDNTYGMGMINVEAAYDYLIEQGHTPADPSFQTDLMLIDVKVNPVQCDERITYDFLVENAGLDTITSFEWTSTVSAVDMEATDMNAWTGMLLPGERMGWSGVMENSLPRGEYDLVIDLQSPNGGEDERALNDVMKSIISISDRDLFPVSVAGTMNSVCENTSALLRSDYDEEASIEWYDAPTEGELLGEGLTYLTEPLTETTTFYAEATLKAQAGKNNRYDGESRLDSINGQILFDAHSPFKIKTVKVYAEETGGRIIELVNVVGDLLASKVVSIQEPGEQEITLDFNVPVGENMRLGQRAGKPLYYSVSNIDYPYHINDLCTIKGSNYFQDTETTYYFYFYDWKITYTDYCGRSPVTVEVTTGTDVPTAEFSASAESVDLAMEAEVSFTNSSENATAWLWNFGDGTTSTEENPSHTYEEVGSYAVTLTATHAGGCAAFATMTIDVTDSTISSTNDILEEAGNHVLVFPNPTSGHVRVQTDGAIGSFKNLVLYNALGMTVRTLEFNNEKTQDIEVDLSDLGTGVYYLVIGLETGKVVRKVVIN